MWESVSGDGEHKAKLLDSLLVGASDVQRLFSILSTRSITTSVMKRVIEFNHVDVVGVRYLFG
jgi:hypothetical protein